MSFLATKQPSTVKNGNQCAWQPVSICTSYVICNYNT
jgi:hypothetical protein